ncbi:MAG: acetylxylan esterase [Vicinamibacterales bacterium]
MNRTITRSVIGVAGVLMVRMAVVPAVQTQNAAPAASGPVQLSRDEDFARTRGLLGIDTPPPAGAVSSSPDTFNESVANPFPTLPDPLKMNNGQRVTSAAMWRDQRRPELIEVFEREIYGRTPKVTPKVTWTVLSTANEMNGNVPVITKQLNGHVDNSAFPGITVNLKASVSTPAGATGPVPVILSFTPGGGFGRGRGGADAAPPPAFPLTSSCGVTAPPPTPAAGAPGAGRAQGAAAVPGAARGAAGPGAGGVAAAPGAARGPAAPSGPTNQQQALALGWGYASLETASVQADNAQSLTCGIIGLVNKGQPRKVDDWGVLAAWAWGASRTLDYFETDKAVDATRIGMYGHSRWGKATLLASVLDTRFAIAYVSSSGQGGAKLHRRKYGETVDNVASTFYYWMAGNYIKYAGKWDSIPVDSHELVALMAPRPVFLSVGNDPQKNLDGTIATSVNAQGQTVVAQVYDAWADPKGSFLAAAAAAPVYELLGKKGLGIKDFPAVDTKVITGDIGFHQHPGGHVSGPAWETFYTFASRHLKK